MKPLILLLSLLTLTSIAWGQVPKFDKLEMLYAQHHYKMVYRRANRLLDDPSFDYSHVPKLYKSMVLFQLSQDEKWFNHHPTALEEARELFLAIKQSSDGKKVLEAHIYEISYLKTDLLSHLQDLKQKNQKDFFDRFQRAINGLFDDVPNIENQGVAPVNSTDSKASSEVYYEERNSIVEHAKKHLGIPYVYAGTDPKGFDCSGFTGYVMGQCGKTIPRRAVDQFEASKKLSNKTVQKGDLIFFDSGGGISHVGLIISDKGSPLVMIHASSSKGIIVTEIEKSDYWMKRIAGFGTFVH